MKILDNVIRSYRRTKRDHPSVTFASFTIHKTQTRLHDRFKLLTLHHSINKFIAAYFKRTFEARETQFRLEVLIPCFNHGRFLATALSSVPAGVSVTVIDDASTDDTKDIVRRLGDEFVFKVIHNDVNLSQAGSLNNAIEQSQNNLFMVLNADDSLMRYCVPTILGLFESHPTIRMAGGSSIPFTDNQCLKFNLYMPLELGYKPAVKMFGPRLASTYKKGNDINMTMSSCTFLKSAWQAVGGFWPHSKRIHPIDDRDFEMRVSALFDVAVIEEPLALYQSGSSASWIVR